MIKSLVLKFGSAEEQPPLQCPLAAMTVLVGPNNSGKSLALSEIGKHAEQPTSHPWKIIDRIELALPQNQGLRKEFLRAIRKDFRWLRGGSGQEDERSRLGRLAKAFGLKGEEEKALLERLLDGSGQEDEKQRRKKDVGEDWRQRFSDLAVSAMSHSGKLDLGALKRRVETGKAPSEDAAFHQAGEELREAFELKRLGRLVVRWSDEGLIRTTAYTKLLEPYTIVLNGTTRLGLVNDTQAPEWRTPNGNHLVNLLKYPERLVTFRRIVHDAFGYYPVIDTTFPGRTSIKLTQKEPGKLERSTTTRAIKYFDEARSIHEFSDGVKSFIGILAAILGNDYKLVLIDEPEAFLHPPLARMLGAELHKLARERRTQVVAATHSPEFLMGCIQTSPDTSIIRLTYKDGRPTAWKLSPELVREMMRDPLLRSTGVLGALFHEGAVVCESDSDRAFYQEINGRLQDVKRGARGITFLNAQNKQTIERIVRPLREMGIPAAAIVDLDVVGDGDDMSRLLQVARLSRELKPHLSTLKKLHFDKLLQQVRGEDVKEATEEDRKKTKEKAKELLKQRGLVAWTDERARHELQQFVLDPLAQRGIFVVPCGELESWLQNLGISRSDKSRWLTKVFQRMGEDPDHRDYVRPQNDDVWIFMERVAGWLASPKDGMPF